MVAHLQQTTGRKSRRAERILIVGLTPLAAQLVRELDQRSNRRHVVVGVLDDRVPEPNETLARWYLGSTRRLDAVIHALCPHRILIAVPELPGQAPMHELLECHVMRGVMVEDAADFYERLTGKLALESLTPGGVMAFGRYRPSTAQRAFAALLGWSAAGVVLLLLAPLLALIAIAIKLESRGPVLFVQERVGAHGRPFLLLKFRTMRTSRETRSEWESDNRDRVTRVGAVLRAFRLDELPQFINVLRGEMNLVGPRPHPATNLELFTLVGRNLIEVTGAPISCYGLRGLVRPGLTGWAQVHYRYANNLEEEIEKLRYDLYYVKHQSPWLDLGILVDTVTPLVMGRVGSRDMERKATATPPAWMPTVAARTDGALTEAVQDAQPVNSAARTSAGTALILALLLTYPIATLAQAPKPPASPSPAAAAAAPAPTPVPAITLAPEYRIGPDDVIEVTVWNNPTLTRAGLLVRPDGNISLPLLNDVRAAGLTPMQLKSALTSALAAGYVKDPEVSVIVSQVHSRKVSITGEVKTPGRYEISVGATVLDVLALAGGLTEYADRNGIVVLRQVGATTKRIQFTYASLAEGKTGKDAPNALMQPGDIIVVR